MIQKALTYEELARINAIKSSELIQLRQVGDYMQSSLSRLREFVENRVHPDDIPYEVQGAMHEAQASVQKWTDVRSKSSI